MTVTDVGEERERECGCVKKSGGSEREERESLLRAKFESITVVLGTRVLPLNYN